MARWFVSGKWQGEYAYDPSFQLPAVPFQMSIESRFGFIFGKVQDDPYKGMPDVGTIRGWTYKDGRIAFTKRMPRETWARFNRSTGNPDFHVTSRRHPPIRYYGKWDREKGMLSGTWTLVAPGFRNTGTWTAQPVDSERKSTIA